MTVYGITGPGGFGGLYNVLFGDGLELDRISLVATTIGMHPSEFGRARDAWVEQDDGDARYALYTRNGGGNREDYAEQIEGMRANPHYLSDKDDTFDQTYATFYFRLPERLPDDAPEEFQIDWAQNMRPQLVKEAVEQVDTAELWQGGIEQLKDPERAEQILDQSGLRDVLNQILSDSPTSEEDDA